MKKIVSMVGVGAMVFTLAMGSAFSQQATQQQPSSGAVVTESKPGVPANTEKDKAPTQKPGTEMKTEKAVPESKSTEKAKDKDASVKPGTDTKAGNPTLTQTATDKIADKANEGKAVLGKKDEKPGHDHATVKPADKPMDKKDEKPGDKKDEPKPATKQ